MKLYTALEVAETLGLSYRTLLRIISRDNSFPAYKIGRKYRIPEDELMKWISQQRPSDLVSETISRPGRPAKQNATATPRVIKD